MKMHACLPVLILLALGTQGLQTSGMAEANLKLATRQMALADAVFHLSEQAKKEELISMKNNLVGAREMSKLLPIEPVLGREMQPDPVDSQ